jgi:hypothetical protein
MVKGVVREASRGRRASMLEGDDGGKKEARARKFGYKKSFSSVLPLMIKDTRIIIPRTMRLSILYARLSLAVSAMLCHRLPFLPHALLLAFHTRSLACSQLPFCQPLHYTPFHLGLLSLHVPFSSPSCSTNALTQTFLVPKKALNIKIVI